MTSAVPANRILIVRLSAIGDVVHALPVACALRTAMPHSFLAWIVESRAADILRGHRAIDELVIVPRGWLKSPATVLALRRRLRGLRFDVAIDVQGLSKSAAAAWLSGARRRIGFTGHDGREVSRLLNNSRVLPMATHVVDRNLELMRALDIAPGPARFELEDTPADARSAAETLDAMVLGDRFAVINPGAGWQSKLWPVERHAAVARHLGTAHGLRSLIVWAGETERTWAQEIAGGSGGFAAVAPRTSLGELTAIARRATMFVSSDSAPLHLAAAVGTPCVGLFGPSSGLRNGPYGPGHIVVQKNDPHGNGRGGRHDGGASMGQISVADVTAACQRVLATANPIRRSA